MEEEDNTDDSAIQELNMTKVGHVEISLHVITGALNSKTMRVKGRINGVWMIMLIDSCNTHNFIDPRVVNITQLKYRNEVKIHVQVASGDVISGGGECKRVSMHIQWPYNIFLYPHLRRMWCSVRVQWLVTLRPIVWDFLTLNMKFMHQGSNMFL